MAIEILLNIDIRKCRVSVPQECYSRVQKRISDIESNTVYIHCAAHNFNLATRITEVGVFSAFIENIFLNFSIKRRNLLHFIEGETITLKRLNSTRWANRVNLIAVRQRDVDIMKLGNKKKTWR